jgi:dihydrofolate reductase
MSNAETMGPAGKVLWNFLMSLDGFVAGVNHDMGWMTGFTVGPGVIVEYIETTGAVLAGRDGFDSAIGDSRPWGGRWKGPIFVLTHHPEDAPSPPDITFLSCPVEEAVRIGLEAAGGRHLGVFSPTVGAQLLDLGRSTRSISTSHRSCSAMGSGSSTTLAATRSASTGSTSVTRRWRPAFATAPPQRRSDARSAARADVATEPRAYTAPRRRASRKWLTLTE